MKKRWTYGLLLGCAALAGCASNDKEKEPPRLCPQTAIVRDLQQVFDYGGNEPNEKELVAVAALRDLKGDCSYNDKGADVKFTLYLAAAKGPRLGGNQISLPFFVALLNPAGEIVQKNMLTTTFTFSGSDKRTEKEEEMHVFIPLPDVKTSAEPYRILTGFQLTESQIETVRKAKEAKIPASPSFIPSRK